MSNLSIRERDCEGAPKLVRPLNDVLSLIDSRLTTLELLGRTFLLTATLRTGAAVAVGTAPFPLRVGIPANTSLTGLVVVRAQNLTTPTVSTTAHAVNAWRQEGNFLIVDFITGLATNTSYQFTLGGFRAL